MIPLTTRLFSHWSIPLREGLGVVNPQPTLRTSTLTHCVRNQSLRRMFLREKTKVYLKN
jgi:hypothetical protein